MGDSQDPEKSIADKMPRLDSDDPAVVRGVELLQGAYIRGWQETLPERFGRPGTLNDVADAVREARKRAKSPQSPQAPQSRKSETDGFEDLISWLTRAWRVGSQYRVKPTGVHASQTRPEILCEECSTYNPQDSKFCSQCGAELNPERAGQAPESKLPKTCTECGKENPPGDRYCNNCGKELP
jgi:hypothetical protein